MKINGKVKELKKKHLTKKVNLIIACDKNYYRPLEVNNLLGDATKARRILGWKPKKN